MEGEGDRVLSKKKLDELVRQVTGGGQGEGEGLAPDVEEVCFHFTFPRSSNVPSIYLTHSSTCMSFHAD
jgi:hypothetical protein